MSATGSLAPRLALAATGSFALAGLIAQEGKGAAGSSAAPGARLPAALSLAASLLAPATTASCQPAIVSQLAEAADAWIPTGIDPDVAALLAARPWPLAGWTPFFILAKHLGIQLAMNTNDFFNRVQDIEDAAHAAGDARPEWPRYWSDGAMWRRVWRVGGVIAAQELAIKLTKHVVENILAGDLPKRTMAAMLANPAGAITAAAAVWGGSRSAVGAASLAEAAASACLSSAWLYGACDWAVSSVVEAGKALWAAWRAGRLGGGAGSGEEGAGVAGLAGRTVTTLAGFAARSAPALLPLLLVGTPATPLALGAALVAAGGAAALSSALDAPAAAALARAVRGQALRCATALAWGAAGAGAAALARPDWAPWAYTVAQLASWHAMVGPALAAQASAGRPDRPLALAAGVAAAAVGVLHCLGRGADAAI